MASPDSGKKTERLQIPLRQRVKVEAKEKGQREGGSTENGVERQHEKTLNHGGVFLSRTRARASGNCAGNHPRKKNGARTFLSAYMIQTSISEAKPGKRIADSNAGFSLKKPPQNPVTKKPERGFEVL